MKSIQKFMLVTVIIASFLLSGDTFSQSLMQKSASLTASQEIFLDSVAQKTWTYIEDAASNHLPLSWRRVAPGLVSDGTYANPTEIGLYMLSYLGAYEMQKSWSPTKSLVEAEITTTLNQLQQWQTGAQAEQANGVNAYNNSVFFQSYWIDNTPPIVGAGDYDHIVPSIDNALLAASLITIRNWADVNDAPDISQIAGDILDDMNFMIWYDTVTHRFQLGDTNAPLGGGPADYYSNENRIINYVARALGQMSTTEFQASLDALVQAPATYAPLESDSISVDKVAWDGSYFTYTAPALFLREMESNYGTDTIEPATRAQIVYADEQNYSAWGLSDAFDLCEFDEPNVPPSTNTYRKQGARPIPLSNPNALEESAGLITPHASALALLSSSYADEAVSNLQKLAMFNQLYSSQYGFKDSVMVKTGDANYGKASCRYSLLAQAYILLAIAEHKTGFIWKNYYLDPQVQLAHQEAELTCSLGPSNAQRSAIDNLENNIADWGAYCDNSIPRWTKENLALLTPSGDDLALRCSLVAGSQAYAKVHCYNNLNSAPNSQMFTADFAFKFSPTTCNNTGGTSTVQALEFTMSKWLNGKRYEFALQWQNVDDLTGGSPPQWRYWKGDSLQWIAFNPPITQCLSGDLTNSPNDWHSLRLEGAIVNDQLEYRSFTIDNVEYPLDISVPPVDHSIPDQLAIAVQLDANASGSPYDLLIDDVRFVRWNGLISLLSPDDAESVFTLRPKFSWKALPGAVRYEVQLDTSNPPTASIVNTSALSYTPSEDLLATKTYYWRVRAIDAPGNPSPWTQIQSVLVQSPDNAAPPLNYFTSSTPTLSWNFVTGASGYEIQIDRSSSFTAPFDFTNTVSADTAFVTSSELADGKWYWRVRALYPNALTGNWSKIDSFVIDTVP